MNLPSGTAVIIPPEDKTIPVKALKITCKITGARRITKAALDPYLEVHSQLHYVLKTTKGDVIRTLKADNVDLGFDAEIKEGWFYVDPKLNFFYFCEKIEGDLIHWILIESYQHGNLIQVVFSQLKEYSKSYVQVTDQKDLTRLRKLLSEFNNKRRK